MKKMSVEEMRAEDVGNEVTDREGDEWVKIDDDLWQWRMTTIHSAELHRDYGPIR